MGRGAQTVRSLSVAVAKRRLISLGETLIAGASLTGSFFVHWGFGSCVGTVGREGIFDALSPDGGLGAGLVLDSGLEGTVSFSRYWSAFAA